MHNSTILTIAIKTEEEGEVWYVALSQGLVWLFISLATTEKILAVMLF